MDGTYEKNKAKNYPVEFIYNSSNTTYLKVAAQKAISNKFGSNGDLGLVEFRNRFILQRVFCKLITTKLFYGDVRNRRGALVLDDVKPSTKDIIFHILTNHSNDFMLKNANNAT